MKANNHSKKDFAEKVLVGVRKAYSKLVRESKKNNEELVFSKNGKVITAKARSLK